MMRGSEWPLATLECRNGLSRHGMNEHCLGSLGVRERGKNRGHPACEHGLPGTRRSNHEHPVAAGSRYYHGPLWYVLVNNIGEVKVVRCVAGVCAVGASNSRRKERKLSDPLS